MSYQIIATLGTVFESIHNPLMDLVAYSSGDGRNLSAVCPHSHAKAGSWSLYHRIGVANRDGCRCDQCILTAHSRAILLHWSFCGLLCFCALYDDTHIIESLHADSTWWTTRSHALPSERCTQGTFVLMSVICFIILVFVLRRPMIATMKA